MPRSIFREGRALGSLLHDDEDLFLPTMEVRDEPVELRLVPDPSETLLGVELLDYVADQVIDQKGVVLATPAEFSRGGKDRLALLMTTDRLVVVGWQTSDPSRGTKVGSFIDWVTDPLGQVIEGAEDRLVRAATKQQPDGDIGSYLSSRPVYIACSLQWRNVSGLLATSHKRRLGRPGVESVSFETIIEGPRGVDTRHRVICVLGSSGRLRPVMASAFESCLPAKRTFFKAPEALEQLDEVARDGFEVPERPNSSAFTWLGPIDIRFVSS